MKFGIHHPSWVDSPDPAEAFEGVKAKAQWAENHGFVWFSVQDHMIQTPRMGGLMSRSWKAGPSWRGWLLSRAASVWQPWPRWWVIAILRISPRSRRASI
jgi:hypothetical protein